MSNVIVWMNICIYKIRLCWSYSVVYSEEYSFIYSNTNVTWTQILVLTNSASACWTWNTEQVDIPFTKGSHITDIRYLIHGFFNVFLHPHGELSHSLTGIILCMHPANETQCYIVTSSLID